MRPSVLMDEDGVANARLRSMLELLLLEDSFLPIVMNWAAEEDWSDLLLFLLEADTLRFPVQPNKVTARKSRFVQDPFAFSRIVNSYLAPLESESESESQNNKLKVSNLIPSETRDSLQRLSSYGIPLSAVFSLICEKAWQKILTLGENLPSKKYIWPALQKAVVNDTKFELVTVLTKDKYRSFLVTFLQQNPPESACLQCWLQVRNILSALEAFKYPSFNSSLRNNGIDNRDGYNLSEKSGGKLRSGKFGNGNNSNVGNISKNNSSVYALSSFKNTSDSHSSPSLNTNTKRSNSWIRPVFSPFKSSSNILNNSIHIQPFVIAKSWF